jgi:nucleotide-binding universal stress UspA family protein
VSTLVYYDGAPCAKEAISVVASSLGVPEIVLLNVWIAPFDCPADALSEVGVSARRSAQNAEGAAREHAREIMHEGERFARAKGLKVTSRLVRSDASGRCPILDVADEFEVGLIVIGAHGLTAGQSTRLGSLAHDVLSQSSIPVLVVPASDRRGTSRLLRTPSSHVALSSRRRLPCGEIVGARR